MGFYQDLTGFMELGVLVSFRFGFGGTVCNSDCSAFADIAKEERRRECF